MTAEANDGGYAYPYAALHGCNGSYGMTLRDHFAGLAMQGIHASAVEGQDITPHLCAKWSYTIADAMLEARKVKP